MIANPVTPPLSDDPAQHVRLAIDGKVATLTLNRPEKKNPLTFDSYAEIANIFRAAPKDKSVKSSQRLSAAAASPRLPLTEDDGASGTFDVAL